MAPPAGGSAAALQAAENRIKRLAERTQQLRDKVEVAEQRAVTAEAQLAQLREQHEALRDLVGVRADRIRELEQLVAAKDLALEQAQAKTDALQASLDEAQRSAESAAERARTMEQRAAQDDLRKIYGIGPKVEERLRAIGVQRYADIAAWTEEDIDRIAPQLKVHAKRIRRDKWVESARDLASA